ncbi:MAG: hypothetical protein HOQ45_11910 [Nocardioidaceae bacterium]|nr:hypothetical protein [Nocardioidaceae bacterium]
MVINREEAVKRALASTDNEPGGCYKWTRTQFGSPAVGDYDGDHDADAVDGWKATRRKHPGDRNPPRGVPVFWSGGSNGYGHAAVSLGGGKIRSTDAGGRGKVATVDLAWPERAWGLTYLGWSDDLAGVTVPLPPKPEPGRIEKARVLLKSALRIAKRNGRTNRAGRIEDAIDDLPER